VCLALGPAIDCDDGNPCTADSCRATDGGCDHAVLPDCCGNALREAGEQCDPGMQATPLCGECRWTLAVLSTAGQAPVVAWWDWGGAGLIAWEESVEGQPALRVRSVGAEGTLGPIQAVPDAVPAASGHFRPALASLGQGRFVLAFQSADAIRLRLLDWTGSTLSASSIPGSLPEGSAFGERLAVGAIEGAALVAWQLLRTVDSWVYGEVRSSWVATATDQLLASAIVQVAGDPGQLDSARLGQICPGGSGALVTLVERASRRTFPRVVYQRADGKMWPIQDLAEYEQDHRIAPACVPAGDGTYLAAVLRSVSVGESQGLDVSAFRVDGAGVPMGDPWTLAQSAVEEGRPLDVPYPMAQSFQPFGAGFAFLSTFVQGESFGNPTGMVLRMLSTSGQAGEVGNPAPIEGASEGFVGSLDVTGGPGGAMLMAWHWMETLQGLEVPGEVRVRMMPAP